MIIVRAPLRISFVGGGTDLPDFYATRPGRVLSATIDKFVYVVINRTPLIDKVSARYSKSETVDKASDLEHTRIRAALMDLGIENGLEIASFATMPGSTGLGSSSSFSVALLKGLHAYQGKKMNASQAAEAASRLEIELVGDPIGKQDQYAAAHGGFNVFQFNPDGSVDTESVLLDYEKKCALEDHMLVFYTGVTRSASSVLTEQKANIAEKAKTLAVMADSVPEFMDALLKGNMQKAGEMLHEGWTMKKSLASGVSSGYIDQLYDAGMSQGAWGGKVLGAGGGGCIMFLAPKETHEAIRKAVFASAKEAKLTDFRELPVKFVQSGTEILFNGDHFHTNF